MGQHAWLRRLAKSTTAISSLCSRLLWASSWHWRPSSRAWGGSCFFMFLLKNLLSFCLIFELVLSHNILNLFRWDHRVIEGRYPKAPVVEWFSIQQHLSLSKLYIERIPESLWPNFICEFNRFLFSYVNRIFDISEFYSLCGFGVL